MGRAPCCSKVGLQRGPWTPQEDSLLINYIKAHGEGLWRSLPKKAGLLRCGKSCRLRWLNYLRPDIKRGNISPDEDDMIIRLHALLGNKWSLIAGRLPGRTDNEIKNYWNTHLSKRLWSEGIDPNTHKKVSDLTPCPTPCRRKRSSAKNRKREMSSETGSDENTTIPRVNVHFPKPVRVTSIKRNSSLASFESDVTNVSALTGDGSGGAAVHGEAMAAEHGEGMTMEEFWPSDDQNVVCDGMEMMVVDGDYDVADLGVQDQGLTLHPHAADLDKIYDEYFQLLKSDDKHVYLDGDQALELDSFAESLLI